MKKAFKILVVVFIFFLAIAVWYSPIIFKGYGANYFTPDQSLSRNLLKNGKFSLENKLNVMLASGEIAAQGEVSSRGNKLNPILSAVIYKYTGLPYQKGSILIEIVIHALALLFFLLVVWKKFDYVSAILFSLVYIFLPVIWLTAMIPMFYGYSLLFLSLAFFVYFSSEKLNYARYATAGVFLGLSFLSRDAVVLLAPALLIWLWFNGRKAILPLFSSMIIIILSFQFAFAFYTHTSINNNQHLTFLGLEANEAKYSDFGFYGHLYPDPYTYHFNSEQFLNKIKKTAENNNLEAIGANKSLANIGVNRPSIISYFSLVFVLLAKHISRFFSLEDIGGPFVTLIGILGLYYAVAKKEKIWQLCLLWIVSSIFILSFVALAQRQHMMDFGFAIALLISLGILKLSEIISKLEIKKLSKNILLIGLTVFLIFQLVLSVHVALSRSYDGSGILKLNKLSRAVIAAKLENKNIIATPLSSSEIDTLNYLTDRSIVKFSNETIKELIQEKKLDWAFRGFKVTHIVGFNQELAKEITQSTKVKEINYNDEEVINDTVSPLKSLFMNLVR